MNEKMIMRPCPFCGSDNLRIQTVWKDYRYVNCKDCRACGPVAKIVHENIEAADLKAVELWNRDAS